MAKKGRRSNVVTFLAASLAGWCFTTWWNAFGLLLLQEEQPLLLSETPVDCKKFLQTVYSQDSPIKDPNEGRLYSRLSKLDTPPFWVSLHNYEYDKTRFVIFDHGYYYEKALTAAFTEILNSTRKNARVLDVGGNVGWFTLLAASMGHHVDVFEPNPINGIRICQSIQLNEWRSNVDEVSLLQSGGGGTSINYYNNGIGDARSTLGFYIPPQALANPGKGTFVQPDYVKYATTTTVQVISLDEFALERGWFQSRPEIFILKVDVEGFEAQVFHGARQLLQSGLVQNIFMEAGQATPESLYLEMLNAGYRLHATGGYMGPRNPYKPSSPSQEATAAFLKELLGNSARPMNLWWKRRKA